jgi:integrase/recombinase XerD
MSLASVRVTRGLCSGQGTVKRKSSRVMAMHRVDAYRMIRRRAADLSVKVKIGCDAFRATGITACLEAGDTLEAAQAMAHESRRTTELYDRTSDEIALDEVERITI